MPDFQTRVSQWANDRNLIRGSDPWAQIKKLREEVEELADAIADNDCGEMIDAIGDCSVVLAIIAEQIGTTLSDCQEHAWTQIKDRRGKMVDGIFVKEN